MDLAEAAFSEDVPASEGSKDSCHAQRQIRCTAGSPTPGILLQKHTLGTGRSMCDCPATLQIVYHLAQMPYQGGWGKIRGGRVGAVVLEGKV